MFTVFQTKCIQLLDDMPKRQSRHCFRSALRHLEKAQSLAELDPAMAVFRGITAEEEAASGLMHALRELKYPGAKTLRPRSHVHKHAVYPFLTIAGLFFGQTIGKHLKEYRLHIKEEDGVRRLTLALPITLHGEVQWAYPIPPLNFGVKVGEGAAPPLYEAQIAEFVSAQGAKSVDAYLKKEANLRNQVLYAGPDGYPEISELKPEFLQEKASHVMTILYGYLLVAPYEEVQPYVKDAIGAFAAMLGALDNADGAEA